MCCKEPQITAGDADSRILLDLSDDQIDLIQVDSANVTLTIENNDTSIHDFDLTVDDSMTSSAWNVTLADETLSTVLPTFSVTTTIIVQLAANAELSDSGSVNINVAQSGSNISTTITLSLIHISEPTRPERIGYSRLWV